MRWQDGLAIYQLRRGERAPVGRWLQLRTFGAPPDNVIGEAAIDRRPRASSIAPYARRKGFFNFLSFLSLFFSVFFLVRSIAGAHP